MNYNPNAGLRSPPGPGRKVLRVNDYSAMGLAAGQPTATPPFMQPAEGPSMLNPNVYSGVTQGQSVGIGFDNVAAPMAAPHQPNYGFASAGQMPITQPGYAPVGGPAQPPYIGGTQGSPAGAPNSSGQFQQFGMFQQPIVQDMAMQYGQRLADQGKQLVENQFEKWVPVAKLKYYFAVDNAYVGHKLRLLFFPFFHKDWSLKYDQEHPVQPRYDINAPDLYLPTMGYITYVAVAGLLLGLQNRFSPEQLGIQASSALAYSIFEMVIYSIILYVMNVKTSLKTLDLLAFTGYKYVNIIACLLTSTLFYRLGYYSVLAYSNLAFGFFLLRTLRTKVLKDSTPAAPSGAINYDPYGNPQQYDYSGGRKRQIYFLCLLIGGQILFTFLLSKHLYLPAAVDAGVKLNAAT